MWTIRQASPRVLIDYSNHVINCRWCIALALCSVQCAHLSFRVNHLTATLSQCHLPLDSCLLTAIEVVIFFAVDLLIFYWNWSLCLIKRNWLPFTLNCMTNRFHFSPPVACILAFPILFTICLPCLVVTLESIIQVHTKLLSSERIFLKWKSIFELTRHSFLPLYSPVCSAGIDVYEMHGKLKFTSSYRLDARTDDNRTGWHMSSYTLTDHQSFELVMALSDSL